MEMFHTFEINSVENVLGFPDTVAETLVLKSSIIKKVVSG